MGYTLEIVSQLNDLIDRLEIMQRTRLELLDLISDYAHCHYKQGKEEND
jgi:hypothetical protein